MSTDLTEALRRAVADRAYHVCEYCLIHEEDTLWGCGVDHVIGRKHGGSSELENLAWACATCNGYKGSDVATMVGNPSRLCRLFHPRRDRWSQCFELAAARIEPLDRIGQATVKLLRLNAPHRVVERLELAEAGCYPTVEALARMRE